MNTKLKYALIISAIVAIFVVILAFTIECFKAKRLESQLDNAEKSVEELNKKLVEMEALCQYERNKSARSDKALQQFETAWKNWKEDWNPREKLKDFEHDEASCDWLDAVIPDSIRLCIDGSTADSVCE